MWREANRPLRNACPAALLVGRVQPKHGRRHPCTQSTHLRLLLSRFSPIWLFATLWTVAHQVPLSVDSLDKNTGVGCHALLQGIILAQGSNLCVLCLLHRQAGSLPLAPPGKPLIHTHWLQITADGQQIWVCFLGGYAWGGVPEKTCFETACLLQEFVYRECGVGVEAGRGVCQGEERLFRKASVFLPQLLLHPPDPKSPDSWRALRSPG